MKKVVNGEWTDWSEWEESGMIITMNLTKDVVEILSPKGRTLKTMNVSDVGEIVAVTNSTITSRKGSWIFTWSKEGKKISARSAN